MMPSYATAPRAERKAYLRSKPQPCRLFTRVDVEPEPLSLHDAAVGTYGPRPVVMLREHTQDRSLGARAILSSIGENGGSGEQRGRLCREIDAALSVFFTSTRHDYDEEHAVLTLFSVVSGAHDYNHPQWMLALFQKHKVALLDAFAAPANDDGSSWPVREDEA